MGVLSAKEGSVLINRDSSVNQIYIITSGCVNAYKDGDATQLVKGDVIGLIDIAKGFYTYQYVAATDVSVVAYSCKTYDDLRAIVEANPDVAGLLSSSMIKSLCHIIDAYIMTRYNTDNFYRIITKSYEEYRALCIKYSVPAKELPMDDLVPLKDNSDLDTWLMPYYEEMRQLSPDLNRQLFIQHPGFTIGFLMKASEDVQKIFSEMGVLADYQATLATALLNENHVDLLDLYQTLLVRLIRKGTDTMSLTAAIGKLTIQMEGHSTIDSVLYSSRMAEYKQAIADAENQVLDDSRPSSLSSMKTVAVENSLNTILEYADVLPNVAEDFRQAIYEYKEIVDKSASNDFMVSLRKRITSMFYDIYAAAFQVSLTDSRIPTILKMFFLFGYVDEELAGLENAAALYEIADSVTGDPDRGIYTFYEWLRAVYAGRKEPSRNEFDTDYTQYVHELKANGKITPDGEKKMLNDGAQKVMFELQNMFPSVNKITYGRITTFCPVFSEHNMYKGVEEQLMNADSLRKTLDAIRSVDFSAFYRDTIFTDLENGITKEPIKVEIYPDIILMPNVGSRGVMWQEIEGKRRTTPARFMIPLLYPEDITPLLTRLVGEYRWEMCKRVQGARWNDVSDPSLTSEYFDYIQFYRKNSELSPDVREKIKLQLQKSKGNFRETFVRDYIAWVTLEGKGSPVLNKVVRRMLFSYCPFSAEVRGRLATNPMYKDYLERYEIKKKQYMHHLDNVYTKLRNNAKPIPKELDMQRILADR